MGISEFIQNSFGMWIFLAMALGLIFPYEALSLIPVAVILLFLLMFLSGLVVRWDMSWAAFRSRAFMMGLAFTFLVFPLVQVLLGRLLLSDPQLIYGLIFSALTPVAMVAPYFTSMVGGDEELSFSLLVGSMLFSPILAPLLLMLFSGSDLTFSVWFLFKWMFLLLPVPLAASLIVGRTMPAVKGLFEKHMSILNMLCLAGLVFILFGSSASRFGVNYLRYSDALILVLLAFAQDFIPLFLLPLMVGDGYLRPQVNAMRVSLSMRNIAIASGILVIFDPKAALAPSLGFAAHAALFSFIPLFKKRLM